MSINREMKSVMLQESTPGASLTGAKKKVWVDKGMIDVAIYKTSDILNTQSVRYNESSHTGLTWEKGIKENMHRLKDGDIIYNITSADGKGRLTTLLLKVVDTGV